MYMLLTLENKDNIQERKLFKRSFYLFIEFQGNLIIK